MANPIAVPGTNVPIGSLATPGGAQGVQGIQGPTAVSADTGNIATLGSDNLVLVPQSTIWDVRMRSFNAVGNPNFEVDQRNAGVNVVSPVGGTWLCDRWLKSGGGTYQVTSQLLNSGAGLLWPGTNFRVSSKVLSLTLTTAQATLGATDLLGIRQLIEGPQLRPLINDNHSIQLLVNTTVAGLKFSVCLRDPATANSLVHLCTVPSSGWTLITIPALPVWSGSGNFSVLPGTQGYDFQIVLAAGSTYLTSTQDAWLASNLMGVTGMSNFAGQAVNSVFQCAFVSHEPGSVCSGLIDLPFTQNYDACLRYYQKSYDYDVAPGTVNSNGVIALMQNTTALVVSGTRFHKPMAKVPTMTAYNNATGAINSGRMAGTDYSVTSFNNPGKAGFYGVNTATLPAVAAGANMIMHYIADSGW